MFSWGDNQSGELGLGDSGLGTGRNIPTRVGTASNWAVVSSGAMKSFAINTSGELFAWGNNVGGRLGLGHSASATVPLRLGTASNWVAVSAGSSNVFAINSLGHLYSWGITNLGFAGSRTVPTRVGTQSNWASVSNGVQNGFAINTLGHLYAWGVNNLGQLGIGSTAGAQTPTRVGTASNWVTVSAFTGSGAVAINALGQMYSWGRNIHGELGHGDMEYQNIPTRVGDRSNWSSVSATQTRAIATSDTGQIYVWGRNNQNLLGINTTQADILVPTPITMGEMLPTPPTNFTALEALVYNHAQIDSSDYYQNTAWDHFVTTLADAQYILDNRYGITQGEVNQMIIDLTTARNALVPLTPSPNPPSYINRPEGSNYIYFDDSVGDEFRVYVNGNYKITITSSPLYLGDLEDYLIDGDNEITIVVVENGRHSAPSAPINIYREEEGGNGGSNNGGQGGDPNQEPNEPGFFEENWPWFLAGVGGLGLVALLALSLLLLRRRETVVVVQN